MPGSFSCFLFHQARYVSPIRECKARQSTFYNEAEKLKIQYLIQNHHHPIIDG